MKFLEWFVKDETAEALGRARWLHLPRRDPRESDEFQQRNAVQQGVLPDHVQGPRLLGAAGICRAARSRRQQGFYAYVVNGKGTAQETLDKLAATWVDTLKAAGYAAE